MFFLLHWSHTSSEWAINNIALPLLAIRWCVYTSGNLICSLAKTTRKCIDITALFVCCPKSIDQCWDYSLLHKNTKSLKLFYTVILRAINRYVSLWNACFINFQQGLETCPLDWRTTIHWSVVPSIFQHNYMYQSCSKN